MYKVFLAAGVAALAITAPAASQPGDGRGGKDRSAQTQKAERDGKARTQRADRKQAVERRSNVREQRVDRTEQRAQRVDRTEQRAQSVDRSEQRVDRSEQRVERVREQRVRPARAVARERQLDRIENRNDRQVVRLDQRRERQIDRIANRQDRQLARLAETRVVPLNEWTDLARGGVWVNGCPPGLAKRLIPCVPPGQLKNIVGQPLSSLDNRVRLQELPSRLRYVYADTDDYYYRYGNGYAYRVDRSNNLISALLPLFGLGLTAGQQFPSAYSNYYMPTGLQSFYPTSQDMSYRYANGYVYQVNPMTGLIENVDPMLGYGYGFGQMMPATYSAYNVPYQYRSHYFDTSDQYYRYAPGAIYQVDPTTSLITAVAALLTGGMTVGQQLPMGYSAYNVPYQYRTTYFDTQNDWYRYSNGNIYQIDPRTQLVTALVAAALS